MGGVDIPRGKPNILVIWGDDIGISSPGCYSDGLMGYRTSTSFESQTSERVSPAPHGEQSYTAGQSAILNGQSVYRTCMSKVGIPAAGTIEKLHEFLAIEN